MDDEADYEITEEVELTFLPRPQALADLGICLAEFEAALLISLEKRDALAAREDVNDDEIAPLEEMLLHIGGVGYKLDVLAEFEIRGREPQ